MDVNQFILTIGALTLVNNLIVEFIKTNITSKSTTIVAFITAEIVTFMGLYFGFYDLDIIATVVLGLSTGLSSTVGYDKIKQCYDSIVTLK